MQNSQEKIKNYYNILNIDPNANISEIKKAYHLLAKKYHPDVSDSIDSQKKMMDINEAYEVLSDSEERQKYDAWLNQVNNKPFNNNDLNSEYRTRPNRKPKSLLSIIFFIIIIIIMFFFFTR